jgi:hypothetical protein
MFKIIGLGSPWQGIFFCLYGLGIQVGKVHRRKQSILNRKRVADRVLFAKHEQKQSSILEEPFRGTARCSTLHGKHAVASKTCMGALFANLALAPCLQVYSWEHWVLN